MFWQINSCDLTFKEFTPQPTPRRTIAPTSKPRQAIDYGLTPNGFSVERWQKEIVRLIDLPSQELRRYDIAEISLLCGAGLPGTEGFDIAMGLKKLNEWAELVRLNTEHWRPLFEKDPARFKHSWGVFKMMVLVTILQKHCGVRYNMAFSQGDYDARDSSNLFLHGLLMERGGTCVTMPLLYIAVGRRLGYPLFWVFTKEHTFLRWEEPGGDRFNIEATADGYTMYDDAWFRTSPCPLTEQDLNNGIYLRNLTPHEVLAGCLRERSRCLFDNLCFGAAVEVSHLADYLTPNVNYFYETFAIIETMRLAVSHTHQWMLDHPNVAHSWRQLRLREPEHPAERLAQPIVVEHWARLQRIHRRKRTKYFYRKTLPVFCPMDVDLVLKNRSHPSELSSTATYRAVLLSRQPVKHAK